jgi:hypothetical protein
MAEQMHQLKVGIGIFATLMPGNKMVRMYFFPIK